MNIKRITTNFFDSNVYLFSAGNRNFMVDCGGSAEFMLDCLKQEQFIPDCILLTHGHIDHISSLSAVYQAYKPMIYIHPDDAVFLKEPRLNLSTMLLGQEISFDMLPEHRDSCLGPFGISVLHTPGHTPGSVCFIVNDIIFSGDTIFKGTYGNIAFPRGNEQDMMNSLQKILKLPKQYMIFSGHGDDTTIAKEKKNY